MGSLWERMGSSGMLVPTRIFSGIELPSQSVEHLGWGMLPETVGKLDHSLLISSIPKPLASHHATDAPLSKRALLPEEPACSAQNLRLLIVWFLGGFGLPFFFLFFDIAAPSMNDGFRLNYRPQTLQSAERVAGEFIVQHSQLEVDGSIESRTAIIHQSLPTVHWNAAKTPFIKSIDMKEAESGPRPQRSNGQVIELAIATAKKPSVDIAEMERRLPKGDVALRDQKGLTIKAMSGCWLAIEMDRDSHRLLNRVKRVWADAPIKKRLQLGMGCIVHQAAVPVSCTTLAGCCATPTCSWSRRSHVKSARRFSTAYSLRS